MESGIREYFAHGIWNPGLWNPEYSSRNPESHYWLESRVRVLLVPLTKIGIQYLESGIQGVESRIQDCRGLPYIGRYSSSAFSFVWFKLVSTNAPFYYINTNEISGELSGENLISSHVKILPLLWLHNYSCLSHQKTIKVKWFGISLVFI